MEFVPWTSFTGIVQRHGGNSGVRQLSCAAVRVVSRLALAELEARAQREAPLLAVLRARPLLDQLRPQRALRILREQRVLDHVAEVARDVGRREGRVENLHVGVADEAQGLGLRNGAAAPHSAKAVGPAASTALRNRFIEDSLGLGTGRRAAATWAGGSCGKARSRGRSPPRRARRRR